MDREATTVLKWRVEDYMSDFNANSSVVYALNQGLYKLLKTCQAYFYQNKVSVFVFKIKEINLKLQTLGLSHNLAETIAQSRVMLPLFIESYKWANSLLSLPTTFESSQMIEGIPFLCNRNLFQASFLLPSNTTLDKDSISSLCGISPIKLLLFDYEKMLKNINKQPNKVLPLLNGSSIHMDHLSIPISHLTTLLESQPLTKVFWKWSHLLFGSSSIKEAVFCGSDPFKTSSEGINPGFSTVKTPFDEMKNELINFIERIIPGKVEHDKQFCQNVPIHDESSYVNDSHQCKYTVNRVWSVHRQTFIKNQHNEES
uniref:E3 ubiquitin-protein ligase listerin n=1 Tax=Heterorhabditis bacteriophora TaxID=37862 RepID=A0A1I7WXR4_HETBA